MNPMDAIAATMRCTECLTEFHPHEGGHCAGCGRPLCRVHGGSRATTSVCVHCRKMAQPRVAAQQAEQTPRAA